MLNTIFSKKVQRQKHPGRWGIVEHQIPSIKVLFKTNTKGHKHPSNILLSKSKTQLVNQRKQKVAFSPGTAHSSEIQSYWTLWGAASPILHDTPIVYIYTSYNRTHIRNAYTLTHRLNIRTYHRYLHMTPPLLYITIKWAALLSNKMNFGISLMLCTNEPR